MAHVVIGALHLFSVRLDEASAVFSSISSTHCHGFLQSAYSIVLVALTFSVYIRPFSESRQQSLKTMHSRTLSTSILMTLVSSTGGLVQPIYFGCVNDCVDTPTAQASGSGQGLNVDSILAMIVGVASIIVVVPSAIVACRALREQRVTQIVADAPEELDVLEAENPPPENRSDEDPEEIFESAMPSPSSRTPESQVNDD